MPDLLHTLQGSDLGLLKIIAEHWGIELSASDVAVALPQLVNGMLSRTAAIELVESLPVDARAALQALFERDGRISWALFTRRFGEVRVVGAARRDRERPDLSPGSPAEVLWYRGLVGRAFLNPGREPEEFAFIPDDLGEFLPVPGGRETTPLGRPASPAECAHHIPANDHILDHTCTLLASLRIRQDPAALHWPVPLTVLMSLLDSGALLDVHQMPQPENTRKFLGSPRAESLAYLVRGWQQSTQFNELHMLPGLIFEGEWYNKPLETRQIILNMLSRLPQDTWWSLSAFVNAVREQHPDFQRPAGDYDSWFIRQAESSNYLSGFSSWDEVDGALLRFIITNVLHWLGIYDLAAPAPGQPPCSFRPSAWAEALWDGKPPSGLSEENALIKLFSDGRLAVPTLAPRSARYQVARFCTWEGSKGGDYLYRITPTSLEQARSQGLQTIQLQKVLRGRISAPFPPEFLHALDRWEKMGSQVSLEKAIFLRAASPEIISALRRTKAERYLGEILSPTVVIVLPGGEQAVRSALVEIGHLADVKFDI